MTCILEIERDERTHPQSEIKEAYGNLFYVKQSSIKGAGLGLFAAKRILKDTKLLGDAKTPFNRMSRFGKPMEFKNGMTEFQSSPEVVHGTEEAMASYEKRVFEKESQEAIDECWRRTQEQWAEDLTEQDGLTADTKERFKINERNHPYALASRQMWKKISNDEYCIAVKYFNPFNTLWGFLNSSKELGTGDNVVFQKGAGDKPDESFYSTTELVTKVDIAAGEELLWYYGDAYWAQDDSGSEDESANSEIEFELRDSRYLTKQQGYESDNSVGGWSLNYTSETDRKSDEGSETGSLGSKPIPLGSLPINFEAIEFDKDHDGNLNREEFFPYFEKKGGTPQNTFAGFDKADGDGNGLINLNKEGPFLKKVVDNI